MFRYSKAICLVSFIFVLNGCSYDINNQSPSTSPSFVTSIYNSNIDVGFDNAEAYDKKVMVLGIMCSAHTYNLNLAKDLTAGLTAFDKTGNLDDASIPDVRFVADQANSTLKCVVVGVGSGKCEAKLNLSGTLISKNEANSPVQFSKTSVIPTHACGGAVKALQTVSADATEYIMSKIKAYDK